MKTQTPRNRIWIGHKAGLREVFRFPETPTEATHGTRFAAVTGPFRTIGGARYMQLYGAGNPHCRCVSEAEKLARLYPERVKNVGPNAKGVKSAEMS